MNRKETFLNYINEGYSTKGDAIILGSAMLDGETVENAFVKIPLKTLNRHGLIAGATGRNLKKMMKKLKLELEKIFLDYSFPYPKKSLKY